MGWHHDEPCRACMALRLAADRLLGEVQPQFQTTCLPGTHRLVPDGTCVRCEARADDIAAERIGSPT